MQLNILLLLLLLLLLLCNWTCWLSSYHSLFRAWSLGFRNPKECLYNLTGSREVQYHVHIFNSSHWILNRGCWYTCQFCRILTTVKENYITITSIFLGFFLEVVWKTRRFRKSENHCTLSVPCYCNNCIESNNVNSYSISSRPGTGLSVSSVYVR